MKKMMRSAAAAGALSVLLAACGGSPTGATPAAPAEASYDSGYTMGSGNREVPQDTTTGTSSATFSDPIERGGYLIGTGN